MSLSALLRSIYPYKKQGHVDLRQLKACLAVGVDGDRNFLAGWFCERRCNTFPVLESSDRPRSSRTGTWMSIVEKVEQRLKLALWSVPRVIGRGNCLRDTCRPASTGAGRATVASATPPRIEGLEQAPVCSEHLQSSYRQ